MNTDDVIADIDLRIKKLYLLKGALEDFKEAEDAGFKKQAAEKLQIVMALMVHVLGKP